MTEDQPPFRDPELTRAARVEDLLARLTLDEKTALLHQFAPAVERLGVAAFRTGQEALHGVAWMGPATVFPQALGLGATWNEELVRRVGEAVSHEIRTMRARDDRVGLNVWAPTVNLLRNPLWGRNEEGYAEDARLTSVLATAYTRGLRGDHPDYWRTAPVLKHWLAHNNETDRATTSSSVRPRVLHEYDLRAFRGAVEAGAVAGVMPAYNLVNGRPNHLSPALREHLRGWTEQELLVCSDAGAPTNLVDAEGYFDTHEEATAAALRAGVDSFTDHGTDASVITGRIRGALERGLIGESDIDTAVRRQLTVRFALGEFDPERDPYRETSAFDTPGHRALAQEAAEQAVVLLKNDGLLPIAPGRRIALVGPLADECKLDWYSGTLIRRSTPLDGLRERFGADRVTFADGADRVTLRAMTGGWVRVPSSGRAEEAGRETPGAEGALDPALLAGRTDLPPLTCDADGAGEATELALTDWGNGLITLRAPDGRYLSVAEDGYVRASADQPGGWVVQETFRLEEHEGGHLLAHAGTDGYVAVAADGLKVADHGTSFEIVVRERGEDAVARAAAGAEVVVVVAGNDPHINGRETEDRRTLALPPHQDRLWRAAHAANPRTLLVLTSGYPYAVADAQARLPALLWTAHGGQAAGTALARVLAGDISPAGRLPQTWYADDADPAGLLDYDIIGSRQTYLYFDGTPLYAFGHGLSYSTFRYDGLEVGPDLRARVTLTNRGSRAADEVVQLYAREAAPRVPCPHRQLVAHARVPLAPGESRTVELTVTRDELGHYDVARGAWTVPGGTYVFEAAASSADIRRHVRLTIPGDTPRARDLPRNGLAAADYDEQTGTEIVDRTKESGDAVTPLDTGGGRKAGELLFRDCDFGDGEGGVTVEAAGEGEVTLTTADGRTLAVIEVGATGGPYDYRTTPRTIIPLSGVHDLRVTLRGPLRLARIDISG
ncbi:glycoside hydrolase family 3 C-terminal domain-containing protein [Streptomyces scopuliridis]|uniref:glycoside hydrolase family 3 C-terminal domain-containing protein n=1 Tax=Streptomyces scopuliridis TaxID=452529 RepID=UPI002DDB4197|nr:glycoside hydrolase family 3 C-terminal domain-containing protein [Streptomyces scopuliridis]WSB38199.1 glycoside hydrolase family 3 C-terminal domain-containing protein [Streptomyces scopuliridis]